MANVEMDPWRKNAVNKVEVSLNQGGCLPLAIWFAGFVIAIALNNISSAIQVLAEAMQ